jgi:hypothetical protein
MVAAGWAEGGFGKLRSALAEIRHRNLSTKVLTRFDVLKISNYKSEILLLSTFTVDSQVGDEQEAFYG